MNEKFRRIICSLEFHLALVALLNVDLGLWSLFIEAGDAKLNITLRNTLLFAIIVYTVLVFIWRKLLLSKFTWILYLAFSTFCLLSGLPYSSNLYFLWVYIDAFLVLLFFTTFSKQRKMEIIVLSSKILICTIFAIALLQKLITPSFMDGSFYYQAFSSGFFGFQFAPFAERFLFQEGLSLDVIKSNTEVMASMNPNLTLNSTILVPIYQSELLLNAAKFMSWSTIMIEGGCLLLFGFNKKKKNQYLNHLTLFAFLIGTYSIVPIIYDWGLTFATLGMATASRKWKPYYLLTMIYILISAMIFAPVTTALFRHYQGII
ncbi:MAG: hypothetical protein ACFB02_19735 [Mastigocoleus sp.]